MKKIGRVAIAAGCLCVLSLCVPRGHATAAVQERNPFARVFATAPASASSQSNGEDVYAVTVIARDMQFVPSVLKVKAGSKVQIRFRNAGKEPHNMTFQTLPYRSATMASEQSTTLDMVAPAPGRYPFYCSVGNHAALGMTGVLNVTR